MAIATVQLTDTFDQWRQKTNLVIGDVNALGASGTVLAISNPIAAQVFVYDGTFFRNVSISGDITIDQTGSVTITGGAAALTKGRLAFAGAIRTLF